MLENSVFKTDFISFGNVDSAIWGSEGERIFFHGAVMVLSKVWIRGFSANTSSIFNILEGMGWKPTIASLIVKSSSTVNELLLGKRGKRSELDETMSLKSSNSRKGPETSTLSLILNWGDTIVISPVPLGWDILEGLNSLSCGGRAMLWVSNLIKIEKLVDLIVGHVRVGVDTFLPGVASIRVVLDNSVDRSTKSSLSVSIRAFQI